MNKLKIQIGTRQQQPMNGLITGEKNINVPGSYVVCFSISAEQEDPGIRQILRNSVQRRLGFQSVAAAAAAARGGGAAGTRGSQQAVGRL